MAKPRPRLKVIRSTEDIVRIPQMFPGNHRLLFRGQNVDKPLIPKIARLARQHEIADVDAAEMQMMDRFQKESVPFLQGVKPNTIWDWLSIAQHQGLPTRLLDWTVNPLIALWFAVAEDPPDSSENGVFWALEVEESDLESPSPDINPFNLTRTYIFQPFHIDQRIVAQSGWFSIHRYSRSRGRFFSLDRTPKYKTRLRKFTIKASSFEKLRKELRLLGVKQSTVFPNLPGLCADIEYDLLGASRMVKR